MTAKMAPLYLMRRKADDELIVCVRVEKPLLGQDGEGRLLVRAALDAVRAVGLSGHGLHDLPVEGQLHVPVGARQTVGSRSKAMPQFCQSESSTPA